VLRRVVASAGWERGRRPGTARVAVGRVASENGLSG
jgi:hypothetical protein